MSNENFVARPDAVTVEEFDTSLRDGGQSLPEDHQFRQTKPEMAAAIASMGIQTIEAGFPATAGDGEEVAEVARTVGQAEFMVTPRRIVNDELIADPARTFTPVITGLTIAKIPHVETTWEAVQEARYPGIHVFLATDERNMRSKHPNMTRHETLEMFQESVRHARDIGGPAMRLEISCELASTTDQAWLETVSRSMLADDEARIDVLNLPDTLGRVDAQHMHHMFAQATRWAIEEGRAEDVTISTHNHNDRGRAVDNSIAAIMGVVDTARSIGAVIPRIQVEVESGHALGERAGNTNHALFALDFLMSIADGRVPVPVDYIVDTTRSKEVAEYVMGQANLEVHPRAQAIGDWINWVFAGVHADATIKAKDARIYSPFNPQWNGHKYPMRIGGGKFQGKRGEANKGPIKAYTSEMIVTVQEIADKAAAFGMQLPDDAAVERVVISNNTQAVETERPTADTEIEAFMAREMGEAVVDTITSHEFSMNQDRSGHSQAEVFLEVAGESDIVSTQAESDGGPVDAIVKGINGVLDFIGDIEKVDVFSLEASSAASAGALAVVIHDGKRFTAYGTGRGENEATIDAYIKAYNLIQRINSRRAYAKPTTASSPSD